MFYYLSLEISAGPPIYCLSDIFGMEWMEYQKVEWIGVRKTTRNSKGRHLLGRCLDIIRGIVKLAIADTSLKISWHIHDCFCNISSRSLLIQKLSFTGDNLL